VLVNNACSEKRRKNKEETRSTLHYTPMTQLRITELHKPKLELTVSKSSDVIVC
jgi:hypothetical protein